MTALLGAGSWSGRSNLPSEGQRELLEVIDEESDRLNRFIEALAMPQQRDGTYVPHLAAVPLPVVARAALGRAETVTRDHRVAVAVDVDLPPLAVDEPSVAEVLYILLDNASKYAPVGTTITVRAVREDDRHVRVSVADEGPGIPEALREKVFEKFYRVPSRESHDPRRTGIGLGLSIARRLVEAQGGRIWIEAPPSGPGTVVIMTLPVAIEATEPQPVAAAAAHR